MNVAEHWTDSKTLSRNQAYSAGAKRYRYTSEKTVAFDDGRVLDRPREMDSKL